MTVLQVRGLTVAYGEAIVFSSLALEVQAGRSLAVMGPSGSGKSSLLGCVTGVVTPTAGEVVVAGEQVTGLSRGRRATARRRLMGMIYQEAMLLPELDVVENVAVTLIFDGVSRSRALGQARERLSELGIGDLADRRLDEISGGQAQRVAVARALVRPEVRLVVADEPTASLDHDNAQRATELLLDQARRVGAGVLLATHDREVARRCDAVLDLRSPVAAA